MMFAMLINSVIFFVNLSKYPTDVIERITPAHFSKPCDNYTVIIRCSLRRLPFVFPTHTTSIQQYVDGTQTHTHIL